MARGKHSAMKNRSQAEEIEHLQRELAQTQRQATLNEQTAARRLSESEHLAALLAAANHSIKASTGPEVERLQALLTSEIEKTKEAEEHADRVQGYWEKVVEWYGATGPGTKAENLEALLTVIDGQHRQSKPLLYTQREQDAITDEAEVKRKLQIMRARGERKDISLPD